MKIKAIILWLVLMPIIIFIDVICFVFGIFSKEVRLIYIRKFYGDSLLSETIEEGAEDENS